MAKKQNLKKEEFLVLGFSWLFVSRILCRRCGQSYSLGLFFVVKDRTSRFSSQNLKAFLFLAKTKAKRFDNHFKFQQRLFQKRVEMMRKKKLQKETCFAQIDHIPKIVSLVALALNHQRFLKNGKIFEQFQQKDHITGVYCPPGGNYSVLENKAIFWGKKNWRKKIIFFYTKKNFLFSPKSD